jgi:hypothetical protein
MATWSAGVVELVRRYVPAAVELDRHDAQNVHPIRARENLPHSASAASSVRKRSSVSLAICVLERAYTCICGIFPSSHPTLLAGIVEARRALPSDEGWRAVGRERRSLDRATGKCVRTNTRRRPPRRKPLIAMTGRLARIPESCASSRPGRPGWGGPCRILSH